MSWKEEWKFVAYIYINIYAKKLNNVGVVNRKLAKVLIPQTRKNYEQGKKTTIPMK